MGSGWRCPHPRLPSNAADGILAASGGMSCQLTTGRKPEGSQRFGGLRWRGVLALNFVQRTVHPPCT